MLWAGSGHNILNLETSYGTMAWASSGIAGRRPGNHEVAGRRLEMEPA